MDVRRSLIAAWLSPARAGLRPISIDLDYVAAPAALLYFLLKSAIDPAASVLFVFAVLPRY